MADSDHERSSDKINAQWRLIWNWLNVAGLWWLLAFSAVLIALIVGLSLTTNDVSVRATILAAGIPAVLTFIVVTIQAAVNKQMAEIMDRQEAEMTRQSEALQESLTLTREHFELVERPAIGIESTEWHKRGDGWIVKSTIVNSGKVYARVIEQAFGVRTVDATPELRAGQGILELDESEITKSPVAEMFIHANGKRELFHCFIKDEHIEHIRDGEVMIFLLMKFKYQGRNKNITYRFENYLAYDSGEHSFKECPVGNYAD